MNRCLVYPTLCLLFLTSACSRVSTLGLRAHQYSQEPSTIVWFQVPGLTAEQVAMLKFSKSSSDELIAMEDFTCQAQMWSYNLYKIRPSAELGLISQMTGSQNVITTCGELPEKPFWDYFSERGYSVGVYEHGANSQQSLSRSTTCAEASSSWGENLTLWLTQKAPSDLPASQLFHHQEKTSFDASGVYYDRSCQQNGSCFTGLYENATSVWKRFKNERGLNVYVIRDFSYLNALLSQNISLARERLAEIEKALSHFMYTQAAGRNPLLLLTSSAAQHIELPESGQQWSSFEKRGRHALFKRTSLTAPAFAKGPRAENFCGTFEEHEVLGRMLFTPSEKQLPSEIIDLF